MSWQDYVNKITNTAGMKSASISSCDGDIWGFTPEFVVTKEELAKLASMFEHQDDLVKEGIIIQGEKYIYLSGEDNVIRGRSNDGGIHAVKNDTCLIVALYDRTIQPQQVATIVEGMGDFLKAHGY